MAADPPAARAEGDLEVARPASLLLRAQTRFAQTVRAGVGGTPVALLLMVGAAAVVLYLFDPATSGFYPPCLFRSLFGFQCPGCGSLRAVHQLLHGNLATAWALNRTVFVALPLAAVAGLIGVIRRTHRIG